MSNSSNPDKPHLEFAALFDNQANYYACIDEKNFGFFGVCKKFCFSQGGKMNYVVGVEFDQCYILRDMYDGVALSLMSSLEPTASPPPSPKKKPGGGGESSCYVVRVVGLIYKKITHLIGLGNLH